MTDKQPLVSVIIPTFNRKKWLLEMLTSLVQQTLPSEQFEVIVVNDGSTDGTEEVVHMSFPFQLRYFSQSNQGDAAARNLGARQSSAEILVFLDDDILLEKDFLSLVLAEHKDQRDRIVVGNDILWLDDRNPLEEKITPPADTGQSVREYIPFVDVCSNNMSIRREAYLSVGLMDDLGFPGSSIWCDVDFSYRAYQKGFEFIRSNRAFCWHRDYVSRSLNSQIKRWREAAYRAVVLFKKYPELANYVPMFTDKTPIVFGVDSPGIIVRKLIRRITAYPLVIFGVGKIASGLSNYRFTKKFTRSIHKWIIGGYIVQGYRDGLRDFGPVAASKKSAASAVPKGDIQ